MPPTFWAVAYVVLLLAAAVVYTLFLSGGFYEPNLRLEPSTRNEKQRALDHLTPILARVSGRHVPHRAGDGVYFDPMTVQATTLSQPPSATEGTLLMSVLVGVPHPKIVQDVWFEIETASFSLTPGRNGSYEAVFAVRQTGPGGGVETADEFPLPRLIAPATFPKLGTPFGEFLVVPQTIEEELEKIARASEGDPSAAPDRFVRMLYLSASTLTTLGIGDIQPVTPLARVAVTAEAVIGLVLVGLFLNALASKAVRHRRDPEQQTPS